jgi:catechol 2,3-dioxygenase-like lactoylglutathione lyase family enzyme
MKKTSTTVALPVADVETAKHWYERILELDRGIEPVPGVQEYEVLPGCWLQLFEGETSISANVLRIGVEDLERERFRLLHLGVPVHESERVEGVIAFCEFADPDSNRLSLYQVLD